MRLLLDKNVSWDLRHYLLEYHETLTAAYLGWDRLRNGQLLATARNDFDVLITHDQGIPQQQNITEADVAVIVLVSRSNSINDVSPLIPDILQSLETIRRGQVIYLYGPGIQRST